MIHSEDILPFNWNYLSSDSEWEVEYESDNDEGVDDIEKAYTAEFTQLLGQV